MERRVSPLRNPVSPRRSTGLPPRIVRCRPQRGQCVAMHRRDPLNRKDGDRVERVKESRKKQIRKTTKLVM